MATNGLEVLNDETFASKTSSGVVLVDFFAEWCGPCKMLTPILEELASEVGDGVTFAKLDIDNAQKTTADFGVTSVPTLVLLKDGKEVQRVVGLKDKETLAEMVVAARG